MTLDYLFLPAGVALLVLPTALVCGARMRETLDRPTRRHNEGLESLLRTPLNWLDLARAAGGTWLVQRALQGALATGDEMAITFLVVELAIFFAGVGAQTLWLRRPVRVIGPIFFLMGMTLALSGLAGGFALVLALACALMIDRLSAVFVLAPLGLLAFGYLFQELTVTVAFNAAVFALPPLLAFRFGTRMSFLRRTPGIRTVKAPVPARTLTVPVRVAPPVVRVEEPEVQVAPVIRPNFIQPLPPLPPRPSAAKPPSTPSEHPAPFRPTTLPDFLRIADDGQEPDARKGKKRLFARKRA